MITVTRPWLPDRKKLDKYIDEIFSSQQLTNGGPLLDKLTTRLKQYLGVKHLIPVSSGTSALQVALRALNLSGNVVTTPFSFVATSSALQWLGIKPVFADINPATFNINPAEVTSKINENTSAILATHVFGNPCDNKALRAIADQYGLKLIYDAAHCFGVEQAGNSVLNEGDISILSFHATKLFHTMEGGAIVTNDDAIAERVKLLINFGIENKNTISLCGTNAKMNEMSAAMGLAVLDDIDVIADLRKLIAKRYERELSGWVGLQSVDENVKRNYGYFPIVLESEQEVCEVIESLEKHQIIPRRYFYPSLDTLDFFSGDGVCCQARKLSKRILCLPIYPSMEPVDQSLIISILQQVLKERRRHHALRIGK